MSTRLLQLLHPYLAKKDDDDAGGGAPKERPKDAFDEEEERERGGGGADTADLQRPSDISEAEWNSLSDAERAAIAEPQDDAESLEAIAGEDNDEDKGEDGAEVEEGEAEEEAGDAKKGADKDKADDTDKKGDDDKSKEKSATADDADDDADDDAAADERAGPSAADRVKEIQGKVKDLETQREALDKKFDDGDIEAAEHRKETRALEREIRTLENEATGIEARAQALVDHNQRQWEGDCARFFALPGNEVYKTKAGISAIDDAVKNFVSEANLKKHPERARMSGTQVLEAADRRVRKELGLPARAGAPKTDKEPTAAEKEAAAAAEKAKNLRGRRPDLKSVPKTLAHAPAADATDGEGDGDEFAAIDKLQGLEQEAAIARLSPAAQERYLRGTGTA